MWLWWFIPSTMHVPLQNHTKTAGLSVYTEWRSGFISLSHYLLTLLLCPWDDVILSIIIIIGATKGFFIRSLSYGRRVTMTDNILKRPQLTYRTQLLCFWCYREKLDSFPPPITLVGERSLDAVHCGHAWIQLSSHSRAHIILLRDRNYLLEKTINIPVSTGWVFSPNCDIWFLFILNGSQTRDHFPCFIPPFL